MNPISRFLLALASYPFKLAASAAAGVAAGILLLAAGLHFGQERLLFPGTELLPKDPSSLAANLGAERFEIPEDSGSPALSCFRIGKASDPAILAFPGNAQPAASAAATVAAFASPWQALHPRSVVSCSPRGHEGAAGSPSGRALEADARRAARALRPVGVFGRSLGTGPAAAAASEAGAPALLVSPYDRLSEAAASRMARFGIPAAAIRLLFRDANEIDAAASVSAARDGARFRILHFEGDDLVLPERSQALASAARVVSRGLPGGHNDSPWESFGDAEAEALLGLPPGSLAAGWSPGSVAPPGGAR